MDCAIDRTCAVVSVCPLDEPELLEPLELLLDVELPLLELLPDELPPPLELELVIGAGS